jgi:UDP-N-acetylglucosamine:LPS N-acetylglucosamine transferase
MIERLKKRKKLKPFKHITIVTDSITINSIWYRNGSDSFIVPNEDTALTLRNAGVQPEKIHPFGFPVQLQFSLNKIKKPHPDPVQSPSILYIINASRNIAPRLIRLLLKQNPNYRLTILTCRNPKLFNKLKEKFQSDMHRINLIDWTTEMPHLLMTHHIVISKGGGATVQEAIAAGCPMIINRLIPGQEDGNFLLLQKHNCAAFAKTSSTIADQIGKIFSNNAELWKTWHQNILNLSQPEATINIGNYLLNDVIKKSH